MLVLIRNDLRNEKGFDMRVAYFSVLSCLFICGCQSIPWRETGPLMKLVDISNGEGECLALADLNGSPIIRNNKAYVIKSPGCKNVKNGIIVNQADSIKIQDSSVRAAIVKLPGGTTSVYRNSPITWKFVWTPVKK